MVDIPKLNPIRFLNYLYSKKRTDAQLNHRLKYYLKAKRKITDSKGDSYVNF